MLWRLFLVCVTVRWLLAAAFLWAMARGRTPVTLAAAAVSYAVSVGFVHQIGLNRVRGNFGGIVWWKRARFLHATLWFLAGSFALVPGMTWWLRGLPPAIDAAVGTFAGLLHFRRGYDL
jgi:hypothetical protein